MEAADNTAAWARRGRHGHSGSRPGRRQVDTLYAVVLAADEFDLDMMKNDSGPAL